ncbi:hypothetical protein IGI39_004089 [Enterococcus sp. AZ135]|uniref:helix-turn-helix domain-containing protein n=2 Tax=Enterococcus TaxID=1350 RepID=UPI003F22CAA8
MIRNDFFESLFDRKTLNQRRMILLLNAANRRWVSSQWLGEKLELSKRMTLSTINDLSDQINQFQPEKYSFQLSKSRGVFLDVKNDADIYELVTFIVGKCSTVKMLEALLTEEFDSVKNYAVRNFISESTVRRDLNKVNELLLRYQIEIGRESAKLIGEEHQIRMFMTIFFWSVYRGSIWPFKYVDEQLIETFVDNLLNNEFTVYPKIPYEYKKQLAFLFAESIIRTRKGNIVQMSSEMEGQIKTNYLYSEFEGRLLELQGEINSKQSEIPFFFSVWLSMSKTMDTLKESIVKNLLKQQVDGQLPVYLATEFMVTRFQEEYFPIKEEDLWRFQAYLFSGHFFTFYYKDFNTDLTGYTYQNIFLERYPNLIKKTKRFIEDLYQESNCSIFLENDYLLIVYLRNIFFLEEPCNYEVKITMLVESVMPRLLTQKFIRQINGYFGYLYNLSICDVFDSENGDVDILLTTSNLEGLCQIYPNAEIVVVSKTLSIVDMSRINQALEEVSAKKTISADK